MNTPLDSLVHSNTHQTLCEHATYLNQTIVKKKKHTNPFLRLLSLHSVSPIFIYLPPLQQKPQQQKTGESKIPKMSWYGVPIDSVIMFDQIAQEHSMAKICSIVGN